MTAPVKAGGSIYVDVRTVKVVALPVELRGTVLTGIMTAHRDRGCSHPRFLSLDLSQDATVFLCYDARTRRLPEWVFKLGFEQTTMVDAVSF